MKARRKTVATRTAGLFDELDAELWLARRLQQHGGLTAGLSAAVFQGVTDRTTRLQRFREAIQHAGLAAIVCGRTHDDKPNTYAQAFERLYGVAL